MMLMATAFSMLTLGLVLLRRATTAAAHLQQQREARSCSLVGDCFARTTVTGSSSSSSSSSSAATNHAPSTAFGTRIRQFLLGSDRPLTLEGQHRRALALARARNDSSGGGGGGVDELSLLQLLERELQPEDYDLLSRLSDADSSRQGATDGELALLPLHTFGRAETLVKGDGRAAGSGKGGSGNEMCAICLCAWEPGDVQRSLPCFHAFHQACVDPWLKRRFQCPLCCSTVF